MSNYCAGLWNFLYNWQTLTSGILAVIVATVTVFVIHWQISEERKRHADALYRKSLSARAQMPGALSAICEFTEQCILWYDRKHPTPPVAPAAAIDALKAGIEFADNDTATRIFELVSFYQIHNARLNATTPPVKAPEDADRLFDTTKLRCLTDYLFPYARNEEKTAPVYNPSQDEMMTALKIITGPHYSSHYQQRYDKVRTRIERTY